MTTFSEQELFRRGYREHQMNGYPEYAEQFFQRRIPDPANNQKTLYFINVYRYTVDFKDRWETRLQLNLTNGATVNIEIFNIDDLDVAENTAETIFTQTQALHHDAD